MNACTLTKTNYYTHEIDILSREHKGTQPHRKKHSKFVRSEGRSCDFERSANIDVKSTRCICRNRRRAINAGHSVCIDSPRFGEIRSTSTRGIFSKWRGAINFGHSACIDAPRCGATRSISPRDVFAKQRGTINAEHSACVDVSRCGAIRTRYIFTK